MHDGGMLAYWLERWFARLARRRKDKRKLTVLRSETKGGMVWG